MSTFDGTLNDAAEVEALPDGTIITWLRILGDPTSAAVAFVRREVETVPDPRPKSERYGLGPVVERKVTVWISPGGWDPQTIESAGVTFPCRVVRFGEFQADQYLGAELPTLVETLDHGGTWGRETALNAAARVRAGDAVNSHDWVTPASVLEMAEAFEGWLNRDVAAEARSDVERQHAEPPLEWIDQAGAAGPIYDAVTADRLRLSDALRAAVNAEREARDVYGLKITATHLSRMTGLADAIEAKAFKEMPK